VLAVGVGGGAAYRSSDPKVEDEIFAWQSGKEGASAMRVVQSMIGQELQPLAQPEPEASADETFPFPEVTANELVDTAPAPAPMPESPLPTPAAIEAALEEEMAVPDPEPVPEPMADKPPSMELMTVSERLAYAESLLADIEGVAIARLPKDYDKAPEVADARKIGSPVQLPENYEYLGAVEKAKVLEAALKTVEKKNLALLTELESRTQWEAVRLSTALRERAAQEHDRCVAAVNRALEGQQAHFDSAFAQQRAMLENQGQVNTLAALGKERQTLEGKFKAVLAKERDAAAQAMDEALDEQYVAMEKSIGSKAEARIEVIEDLTHKVKTLEELVENDEGYKKRSHQVHRVVQSILSVTDLMETSKPFSVQLRPLREVALEDSTVAAAVEQLPEDLCRKGVQTYMQLYESFRGLEPETRRVALMPEDGNVLWYGFTWAITKLKFTEKGQMQGDTCDAILARAEDHLAKGNLTGAVKEVSLLQGKPGMTMNEWRHSALARLKADQAITMLKGHAACQAAQLGSMEKAVPAQL
jgi:hypothetical protein